VWVGKRTELRSNTLALSVLGLTFALAVIVSFILPAQVRRYPRTHSSLVSPYTHSFKCTPNITLSLSLAHSHVHSHTHTHTHLHSRWHSLSHNTITPSHAISYEQTSSVHSHTHTLIHSLIHISHSLSVSVSLTLFLSLSLWHIKSPTDKLSTRTHSHRMLSFFLSSQTFFSNRKASSYREKHAEHLAE
jgi:hypothetical protein